jgi:hypothetical protein
MKTKLVKRMVPLWASRWLLTVVSFLGVSTSFAQVSTVIIPVNNDNDHELSAPYGCADDYIRTQALYYASEIGGVGTITSIGFYVNDINLPAASTPIVIKMRNTTKNSVRIDNYDNASNRAITVYNGNVLASQLLPNSWVNIPLTIPFEYAGYNLEVFVETNMGFSGENWDSKKFRWSNSGSITTQRWISWGAPPSRDTYGEVESNRPNLRLMMSGATPMLYDTTIVSQVQTSTYAGKEKQTVLAVEVNTKGQLSPLQANSFTFDITGTSLTPGLLSNARLYYTGISDQFDTTKLFGSVPQHINGQFVINGTQALSNGANYFWLTFDIDANAQVGDSIDAELLDLTINSSTHTNITGNARGNIKVGKQYSFELGNAEGFYTISANRFDNQWELGVPQIGPAVAAHGSSCWGTGLNGLLEKNRDIALYSPSYVMTNGSVTLSFNEWYDFLNRENDFYASVEYSINNDKWETIITHAQYGLHSSNNQWQTVFTDIHANAGDTIKFRWNVYTSEYAASSMGWYIDHVVMTGAEPINQFYLSSYVSQVGGIALPNKKDVPVVNIIIDVLGAEQPLEVTAFDLDIIGASIVDSVHVYYTGASKVFNKSQLYGSFQGGLSTINLSGSKHLQEGINNFWVVYDVASHALENDSIDAICSTIHFNLQTETPLETNPYGNVWVGASIDFETPSDHQFSTYANDNMPSEWEHGVPTYGPTAAHSGSQCWGTNLSGNYSADREYYLLSQPYQISKSDVYVQFSHWFDFFAPYSSINADFEYKVNNSRWQNLYSVDIRQTFNSKNKWEEVLSSIGGLNIGDVIQFRWSFKTDRWIDPAAGWYIDDFCFSGLELFDQFYVDANVESLKEVTYAGKRNQPIVRLSIETAGEINPLKLVELELNTNGSISASIIDSVRVYYTANSAVFNDAKQFGETLFNVNAPVTVNDTVELVNGFNYFWLVYDVNAAAQVGDSLDGEFTKIQFAQTSEIPSCTISKVFSLIILLQTWRAEKGKMRGQKVHPQAARVVLMPEIHAGEQT